MKAVVIYESMYGNTKTIAEAIARGFGHGSEAVVVPVSQARPESLDGADLVVVGGPTHVHGMSRASTRNGAAQAAAKPGSRLTLVPGAEGTGLREWFAGLGQVNVAAAAFDTRLDGVAVFTGRASKGVARQLREHGCTLATRPESFLVTGHNQLRAGEEARALGWGRLLSSKVVAMKLAADSSS
ncbi:MAG TPA: flavodoxin domain-containing protein [Streptosporangiaceae bacterium]|nr:flavodoxin domain-containing protein [Streptosporangiaceae bacterium]